jgi:hypothetical protein
MITKQSEYVLLSLLGPRPVFWHDEKFDEVLCAWNGIKMTQAHALMLVSTFFFNSSPTPEMRRVADSHLYFLWSMNAFEDSKSWEFTLNQNIPTSCMHNWYKKKIQPLYQKQLLNTDPAMAYDWLNLKEYSC